MLSIYNGVNMKVKELKKYLEKIPEDNNLRIKEITEEGYNTKSLDEIELRGNFLFFVVNVEGMKNE